MLASAKHPSLFASFVRYNQNEVLFMRPQDHLSIRIILGQSYVCPGNPYLRGRLSTVGLLVLTSLNQLLLTFKT